MKLSALYFSIIIFFLTSIYSYSQNSGLIRGSVKVITDDDSYKPGENAELILTKTETDITVLKTFSGKDGLFEFRELTPGSYELRANLVGYKPAEKKRLEISGSDTLTVNFLLSKDTYTTEEIDIISERFRQAQNDMRTSLINLSPKTTKILPGVGEDVLRSLQTLPGVSAPNDFSSQLIVRGSGPDQNLIVMDDVEIFNPYRLYGVFSMFNPETLEDINLITGGFPSKYGDRLSAVLDVTNKEGNRKSYFNGLTNVSISNANLVFGGKLPLGSLNGSWIVSTRRSYYDLILAPFAKNAGLIDESASFPSFEDVQSKITINPFTNHKFSFNAIFSKDGVNIIPGSSKEMKDSVNVRDVTKNDVLSFAWHYAPSNKFLTRTTLSWYRNSGDASFGGELLDPVINKEIYDPEIRDSLKALGLFVGMSFDSKYTFRKYSLQNNTIFLSDKERIEIGGGIDLMKTDLNFLVKIDEKMKSFIQSNPNFSALDESFFEGKDYWRGNLYLQDRLKISDKLYFQAGLRLDYYDIINKAYLSPRLNLSYAIDKVTTLRLGSGIYYQSPGYEKLIDGQVFYDLSEEKVNKLEAERSAHFILGIDRWLSDEWFVKFETYYKKFDNLIVQEKLTGYRYEFYPKDPNNISPEYLKNPDNWIRSSEKLPYDSLTSIPINGATGKAYGFEFFIEKKSISPKSKFSGWISYSLSWANRDRDNLTTPFKYDQRHSLNVVANYRLLKWLEAGARFNYSSNFPLTKPLGIKPRVIGDSLAVIPVVNTVQFDFDFGDESNIFTSKKPDYHRLDIRLTAYTKFWNVAWAFYIDVINIYNNKNVIGYDYYIDENLNVKEDIIGQFPILPTLGINARF